MSRKKRRRRRLLLIVPLLVLTGLVLLVELHLSPYIRELARNQAVNAASNAIIEAVSEMLLYSQGGEIEVFSAVPKHWNALSFSGLCGENGLILSAEKKNGVTTVTMYARQAGSWHLRNTNKIISLRQGETTTQIWRNSV